MSPFNHPCLTALSAVLEDAAATLQKPVEALDVELVEAREWPDTGLGLKPGGRAITPGYLVRLGDGTVYRTDRAGNVAREDQGASGDDSGYTVDTEIRLRFTEEGGIAGGQTSFETDSTQLSDADEAKLRRLVTDADFFNIRNAGPHTPIPDGITTRLWIAVGRRNHEVVRGDGIDMDDTPAFHALLAWAADRTPPRFPGMPTQME